MSGSILCIGNYFSAVGKTRTSSDELAVQLSAKGWKITTTSSKKNKFLRLADMVFTIISHRSDYDVALVDVYSGMGFIWAEVSTFFLKRKGKPFILTLHGGNLPLFSQRNPKRVRRFLNSATLVTAPSEYLVQQMSIYRKGIRKVYNGIDITQYHCHAFPKNKQIIWLRTFHKIYNPTLAPQVLSELKKIGFEIPLTMIGPDKGDGSLQATLELAKKLDVIHLLTIIPGIQKTEVPAYLSKAEIFLNTTNVDNAPVSVIEALASGLDVVSTNVGGLPFLLEDGIDALLVPADNAQEMANAIKQIITNPRLAQSLSDNARMKAELFDWSIVTDVWRGLLDEIINLNIQGGIG
jgi:glycosyltransferase involved in cell wall biosynthesis